MSDITITTELLANDRDYRWAASSHGLNATQGGTVLVAGTTEATHWPNGHLKRGLVLAKYSSGPNVGLLAPYIDDATGANPGLGVPYGIVIDGFAIGLDTSGSPESTVVFGALVLAGVTLQLFLDFLPKLLLEDGSTPYTIVPADLTSTAWIAVDL